MMQTILGTDQQKYSKALKSKKILCIVVAVIAVVLNVVFCLLRNDDNHTTMLILNVAVDLFCAWFVIFFCTFVLPTQSKQLSLYSGVQQSYKGVVTNISTDTQRTFGLDCLSVAIGDDNRTFFLPDNGHMILEVGKQYVLQVCSNVIVEVTDCE